jgi:hypothetical protein
MHTLLLLLLLHAVSDTAAYLSVLPPTQEALQL